MGGSNSVITREQLEEYIHLTYLSKSEILYILGKFSKLGEHEIKTNLHHRFHAREILELFPQLKFNPFRDHIIRVFSSMKDNCFSFEDFLDLCSVMSKNCPIKVKAAWAFKVFDVNQDNQITKEDIFAILDRLTHPAELQYHEKIHIGEVILNDINLLTTGGMSQLEFLHSITKMPEFSHAFYFKV